MAVVSWVGIPADLFAKSKSILKQGCFTLVQWTRIQQKSQSWSKGFYCSQQEDKWCNCPSLPSLSYSQIKFKLLHSTPTVCTSHKFLCWLTHISLMRIIVGVMGGIWVLSPLPQTIQSCAFPGASNSSEGLPSNDAPGKVLIKWYI